MEATRDLYQRPVLNMHRRRRKLWASAHQNRGQQDSDYGILENRNGLGRQKAGESDIISPQ